MAIQHSMHSSKTLGEIKLVNLIKTMNREREMAQ